MQLKRDPQLALLTVVARPSLADNWRSQHHLTTAGIYVCGFRITFAVKETSVEFGLDVVLRLFMCDTKDVIRGLFYMFDTEVL